MKDEIKTVFDALGVLDQTIQNLYDQITQLENLRQATGEGLIESDTSGAIPSPGKNKTARRKK